MFTDRLHKHSEGVWAHHFLVLWTGLEQTNAIFAEMAISLLLSNA